MMKTTFLTELQRKLKGLPESEVMAAVAYYDEYLSEAGPENEAAAIAELGSPAEVAAGIMGDYVYADTTGDKKTTRKGFDAIWLVVLGIFASPIALPLAIFLVGLIFGILLAAVSVVFSLFLTAAIMLVAGIAYLGTGFFTLFFNIPTGFVTIGSGLVLSAVGATMMIVMIWLTKHIVNGVARGGAKLLQRWRSRDATRTASESEVS